MSLVILEGPDGAGKTHLAEQLARGNLRGARLAHHGAYLGQQRISHNYLRTLYAALLRPVWHHVIMDRSWVAEPIYGAVMREGQNRISVAERRMLSRVAMGVGAVVVLCLPPYQVCEAAWKTRLATEYPQRKAQLRAIYERYVAWARAPEALDGPPILRYDWTRKGAAATLSLRLVGILAASKNDGPGIGRWPGYGKNSVLMIGDRPSARGHARLPFVSLRRDGCSAWLAERLEEWRVPEHRLYWVNQKGLRVEQLGEGGPLERFDQIIALGANAERWCARNGVPCTPCEHPQYWKRFHAKAPGLYPLRGLLC